MKLLTPLVLVAAAAALTACDRNKAPAPQVNPPASSSGATVPPAQAPGVTTQTIAMGQTLFFGNCALCHSNQLRSITPDLRRMPAEVHKQFNEIVLHGLFLPGGMPRWDDRLTEADANAIHAYLIDLQAKTRADELEKRKRGLPLDAPQLTILSNY